MLVKCLTNILEWIPNIFLFKSINYKWKGISKECRVFVTRDYTNI